MLNIWPRSTWFASISKCCADWVREDLSWQIRSFKLLNYVILVCFSVKSTGDLVKSCWHWPMNSIILTPLLSRCSPANLVYIPQCLSCVFYSMSFLYYPCYLLKVLFGEIKVQRNQTIRHLLNTDGGIQISLARWLSNKKNLHLTWGWRFSPLMY